MKKGISGDDFLYIAIDKAQTRFERIKNPQGADKGVGHYLLVVDVTSKKGTVHIPLSIASGKKVTGFMYQIEGTATGSLSTAQVSARGEGVTQVTLGTLRYVKIPEGKTASFRIQVEIKGKIGNEYLVVIHQINYKLNATDARYKKFLGGVSTRTLEFK
jgi:hypothetical protein